MASKPPEDEPLSPKPAFTGKDAAMGCGCAVIVLLFAIYVITGVNQFFNPPRPTNLPEPVRDTQTDEEKSVRRELEHYAHSAFWERGDGKKFAAAQLTGPEPRPGVSVLEFYNQSGRNLDLLFDGDEIFKVEVKKDAAAGIEMKSGDYDYLIVAPGGQGVGIPLAPLFRRCKLQGKYTEIFVLAGEAIRPIDESQCPALRHCPE